MSDLIPQAKVLKALHQSAKVQATVTEPRLKIEAAMWQMFFELPLSELLRLRDGALNPSQTDLPFADVRNFDVAHDEEPLGLAASKHAGGAK